MAPPATVQESVGFRAQCRQVIWGEPSLVLTAGLRLSGVDDTQCSSSRGASAGGTWNMYKEAM